MNFFLNWWEEMAKLRGLGKGLDVLLASNEIAQGELNSSALVNGAVLQEIELSKIRPGKYQPRQMFDEVELQELADSIKHSGVIQPIVVRKDGSSYEIIAGERRYRASKLAGLKKVPAVIRTFNDEEALAIALIENIQRKDLNVLEEARGYRRLIDEFKLTHEELAKVTGRSRSHITNILRLLNLNSEVQEMVLLGQIDMGHARALLPLSKELQLSFATDIIDADLTTAEVERQVARLIAGRSDVSNSGYSKPYITDPDITKLETKIADRLGMMTNIKHKKNGSGKVVLNYSSLDELDNLLNLFE
jgi:ParB family chromosome partitioning protein